MPRYDYQCPNCGEVIERNVPVDYRDQQWHRCPDSPNPYGGCGYPIIKLNRISHFHSLLINIPEVFKHKIDDKVLGIPEKGSEKWKNWQKRGIERVKDKDFDIE